MSAAQVDPHDKMRSRDVSKVARGEQAPRPAHEPGQISQRPSKPNPDPRHHHDDHDQFIQKFVEPGTAPADIRFPANNQTRHCYARYIEYHRCLKEKDEEHKGECEKFAKYYRALCPSEWIERWNEQREQGNFPGPI
ncbi:Cytochrome c oxidase subunit 6b-2 [Linum perenne]